jgi:acetoacetyl-CoA synthetase
MLRVTEQGSLMWNPAPERAAATAMAQFRIWVAEQLNDPKLTPEAVHTWSTRKPGEFWQSIWRFCNVIGDPGDPDRAFVPGKTMREARILPDAQLSLAENLLRRSGSGRAVVFAREDGVRRTLSWDELRTQVAALSATLRDNGVREGDRVAAWMPNSPETAIAMLAANALGAVFTSTSPDFGVAGVLDRFGQVEPTVLIAADGYVYGGKRHDRLNRLAEVVAGLSTVRATLVVGELTDRPDVSGIRNAQLWADELSAHEDAKLAFNRLPFDAPGFVLYSSGTTGKPKCIVHRAGSVLLKHLVEHRLHSDIRPDDRVFYFTTCGWMMWNWLISALAQEATLVLFDGSPLFPESSALFDLADELDLTFFGTSAKFLDAVRKAGVVPRKTHQLTSLRTIASTGSPLSAEGFAYVYESVKPDVHLASISGGTDIVGCFVMGDPTRPVYAGEIQGPALGMAVDVWDDAGKSLHDRPGERGELVCTAPFPSMPLGFWGDADGSRYQAAYFETFPGVWAHGDFASWTEHDGLIIHGRSDATLNAGGVRIGTAEIYRQVEQLDEVAESLAIGQPWNDDTRIVLFVRMTPGNQLEDAIRNRIKRLLRENCSPRHVPARIIEVDDLPRTRSGKLAELAVADVVAGREVRNREALANPEVLDSFRNLPELGQ